MDTLSSLDRIFSHSRYRRAVWFAFGVFWAFDLATTVVFFVVSYLHERNLLTVISYRLFGLGGVGLAAVCYAAVVLGIVHALPDRFDTPFLTGVTLLYASFAFYNATLIAQTTPLT
jgi:hypothetical protein